MNLEALADKATQLDAMLTVMTCNPQAFESLAESVRQDYLCACASQATDLRAMTAELLHNA